MRKTVILITCSLLCSAPGFAAQKTAQAKMFALSFLLHQGLNTFRETMNVDNGLPEGADEVPPWIGAARDPLFPMNSVYYANLVLNSTYTGTSVGYLTLYPPLDLDANSNNIPDFFEASQPMNQVQASGYYNASGSQNYGNISVEWVRNAGSKSGICYLLYPPNLYDYDEFTCAFEILEYSGLLNYTPATNSVAGSLDMVRTGSPAKTLKGTIQWDKLSANSLVIHSGSLTNESLTTFTLPQPVDPPVNPPNSLQRDPAFPTYYAGVVDLQPYSYMPFATWMLWIKDTNDSDSDGLPDFSDDPSALPQPRRPQLTLTKGNGNLSLKISGDTGYTYDIQRSSSLTSGWTTVQPVTLTTDPQTVPLSLPGTAPQFWRLRWQ